MLFGAGGGISCLATTESNGGLVAYATKDTAPTVHIHDLDAPSAFVRSIPNVARARVSALAFSRDGKFLAIASAVPDLELRVIDPRTGDEIVTTSLPYDASALAFNPFNAYELIATHADAAGAASGDVPGVSVTIVDKVFETYLIRRVAIRSEDVGVNPTSLTGAAWSPSGNAYVGTSLGGVLIVDAKTGEVTSRSASAVDGGAGPTRAFAFTKEHVFVGGGGGCRGDGGGRRRRRRRAADAGEGAGGRRGRQARAGGLTTTTTTLARRHMCRGRRAWARLAQTKCDLEVFE